MSSEVSAPAQDDSQDDSAPQPAVQLGPGERPTPRRGPGPVGGIGPGRGPAAFMGGMSTEKALNFRASSRRLLTMLSPQRPLITAGLGLGVTSVTLSVLGPRLLGNVTNLIFTGLASSSIPPGVTQAEFVAHLRATGHGTLAEWSRPWCSGLCSPCASRSRPSCPGCR